MKPIGLIKRLIKNQNKIHCLNCKYFVKINSELYGCLITDKLIMPDYIPYTKHGNLICEDAERLER